MFIVSMTREMGIMTIPKILIEIYKVQGCFCRMNRGNVYFVMSIIYFIVHQGASFFYFLKMWGMTIELALR